MPSASLKLLSLNQDHPAKKRFFWLILRKIEVMIISLKEMLQLQKHWSHDHICNVILVT